MLKVLTPIWLTKRETARRVRQRIGTVLDWSTTEGCRPAHMVNAAQPVTKALPKQSRRKRHHPAVPWREVPAFLAKVRECPSTDSVRYALEFLLLTAARTKEVRLAAWSEVDLDAACWTRPPAHMKAKVVHRVPLSSQAVQLLKEVRERWPNSRLLFPGRDLKRPLTDMALLMLMRRLKWLDGHGNACVPDGLRSSFRDWGADNRHDRDLSEMALAHELENDTEPAYLRSDLFEQRRPLMQAWADFCTGTASRAPMASDDDNAVLAAAAALFAPAVALIGAALCHRMADAAKANNARLGQSQIVDRGPPESEATRESPHRPQGNRSRARRQPARQSGIRVNLAPEEELLPDDVDDEFGVGSMDMEDDFGPLERRPKPKSAARPVRRASTRSCTFR